MNGGSFQVSMISSNTIYHINNRLNMLAGITDPGIYFGGYLIFFFGFFIFAFEIGFS